MSQVIGYGRLIPWSETVDLGDADYFFKKRWGRMCSLVSIQPSPPPPTRAHTPTVLVDYLM